MAPSARPSRICSPDVTDSVGRIGALRRLDAGAQRPCHANTSEAHAVFEKNSLAFDVRPAAKEKIADFGRMIAAVVKGV